jgi:hypothetical protein
MSPLCIASAWAAMACQEDLTQVQVPSRTELVGLACGRAAPVPEWSKTPTSAHQARSGSHLSTVRRSDSGTFHATTWRFATSFARPQMGMAIPCTVTADGAARVTNCAVGHSDYGSASRCPRPTRTWLRAVSSFTTGRDRTPPRNIGPT